MSNIQLQTSNIGRDIKGTFVRNEIKKLDDRFKRSFIMGALFIAISFSVALLLGYALLGIVTVVLGAVLGVSSVIWQVYSKTPEKKAEEKLDGSPPGLYIPRRISLHLSDAKMRELGDEIYARPSVKKPNRLQ